MGQEKRRVMHLQVGDENWTPTTDELQQVMEMFMHAINERPVAPVGKELNDIVATIATSRVVSIKATSVDVTDVQEVRVEDVSKLHEECAMAEYQEKVDRLMRIRSSLFLWNMSLDDVDALLLGEGYDKMDELEQYPEHDDSEFNEVNQTESK
jgi:hypothetical protein